MTTQFEMHAGLQVRISQPDGEIGGWTAEVFDPASGRRLDGFENPSFNGRAAVRAAALRFIEARAKAS